MSTIDTNVPLAVHIYICVTPGHRLFDKDIGDTVEFDGGSYRIIAVRPVDQGYADNPTKALTLRPAVTQ